MNENINLLLNKANEFLEDAKILIENQRALNN